MPYIKRSAVVGLFKRQNEGIIEDFKNLKNNYESFKFTLDSLDKFQVNTNSSITTDPSQQKVVETLNDTQYKIIQGPPGTGKSQTLTAIITNALEHGRNILVVCEKRTAMEVIQSKLNDLGLGDLVAVIDDEVKDRKEIVKRVRDMEEKLIQPESFDENKYNFTVSEYQSLKLKYNEHHNIIVNSGKIGNTEVSLDEMINSYFTSNSYKETYYVETNKIKLDDIYKIQSNVLSLTNKIGTNQILEFEKIYNENYNKIESYESFFADVKNTLDIINHSIQLIIDGVSKHNEKFVNFNGLNKLTINLFSIFNAKLKDIKNNWTEVTNDYNKINKFSRNYVNQNINTTNLSDYEKQLNQLASIISNVVDKREGFISFVEYKKDNKNSSEMKLFTKNFIDYTTKNGINDLDEYLIISYYNSLIKDSGLKSKAYKEYIQNMDKLIEFDNYIAQNQKYRINKYWYELRDRHIKVFNQSDNLKAVYNLRKNTQFSKINTLREIIEMNIDFFKMMFPVIMTDPDTCSAIFPLKEGIFDLVIFDEASQLKLEEVLPSLIRGKYKIISGDMHQMPPSNYFGAELKRDNNSINDEIDDETAFLADSESLLEYVGNLNKDNMVSYLDFHYRSKNPKLINFSNAAFYDSRLVPMPAKAEYIAIEYNNVKGEYKTRKNEKEANEIIDFLFSDKILIDGKVPEVGVVTLNQEQKDFIVKKMNEYIRNNDTEIVKARYNELLEKRLFIKNLENVQGDERDIMILSTTFGLTAESKFIQNFGPINNQTKGYKLLNVLITRAKYKFVVFTSIPEENIGNWEKDIATQGNHGKAIFYAYLAYVKAISENNVMQEEHILSVLSKNKISSENYEKEIENLNGSKLENIFKEIGFLDENDKIIRNYRIGGFTIDYAIIEENETKPKTLIDMNTNNVFSDTVVSYKTLIYRTNMFKSMGYNYKIVDIFNYL